MLRGLLVTADSILCSGNLRIFMPNVLSFSLLDILSESSTMRASVRVPEASTIKVVDNIVKQSQLEMSNSIRNRENVHEHPITENQNV